MRYPPSIHNGRSRLPLEVRQPPLPLPPGVGEGRGEGVLEPHRPNLLGIVAVLVATALPSLAAAQVPCRYDVSAIIQGPVCQFTGPTGAFGTGISPNGRWVCGYYPTCDGSGWRAYLFDTQTNQFTTLSLPPGITISYAWDVNDTPWVVGEMAGVSAGFAYVFDFNTSQYIAQIPPLVSGTLTLNAINSQGVACGTRAIQTGPTRVNAFIWSPKDGGITDLGIMIEPGSVGLDINTDRTVVGYAGLIASPSQRGFIYANGRVEILPQIPGGLWSSASRINDRGMLLFGGTVQSQPEIIGHLFLVDGEVWTPLLPLPGFVNPGSGGLSNDGTAVGRSHTPSTNTSRATLWRDGQPIDLQALVPQTSGMVLEIGRGISDNGWIVVAGRNQGRTVAFVLSPVMPIAGDTNCNSRVDMDDLLNVISQWGLPGSNGDLNADGIVNVSDLLLVIESWTGGLK